MFVFHADCSYLCSIIKILEEIKDNGIKIYPLPDCDSDEDEDYKEQVKQLKVSS